MLYGVAMVKFNTYEWDSRNTFHILRHGVIPNEVEEACHNNPLAIRTKEGRYLVLGRSDAGRYLSIVVVPKGKGVVRVITARDMDYKERNLFERKKR